MRIIAVTRDLGGDARRQHLLDYFSRKVDIGKCRGSLARKERLINLIRTFSPNKDFWRERSKKNPYFFKEMSRAVGNQIKSVYASNYDFVLLFEGLYSPGLEDKLCGPYIVYEDTNAMIARRKWPAWVPDTMDTEEYRSLERGVYGGAAKILTATNWTRRSFIEDYGISPTKVETVYMGCNLPLENETESNLDRKQILFVGYDFERKGGYILLEAFRRIRRQHPAARLIIVGPRLRLREEGVGVLGRLKDPCQLLRLYRESLVLALPAHFDPVPTAALEALSVGTPIITTDSCGVAEFIEDGVHGFIIPTGNVEALADRLLELMTDPLRAKRMGEEGRKLVDARFRWDLIADRILWILRKKL